MCILWLPVQCFYKILECTNEQVPVFCVFSVHLVFSYYDVLVFILSDYILLFIIPQKPICFQ